MPMRLLLLKFSSVLEGALVGDRSQIGLGERSLPGSRRPIMDAMSGSLLGRCLGLSALLAGGPVLAHGDGTFEAPFSLRAPNAVCCTAGDFNGDGKLDLAA